ncbi:hypothetical protein ILYODFUR_019461 [Ilyodon furcidens]|uniref:Uncharacterized protein n=1 Tax=Ilyodon furcidens TaxID=33524 RepID=A0ABV0V7W1_9TELE
MEASGKEVEADRGVETVAAGGEDGDLEADRDVETVAAGTCRLVRRPAEQSRGPSVWSPAPKEQAIRRPSEQSRGPSGRQIRRPTMERRGPSRNSVELRRLGVRLGTHGAWRTLRG